MSPSAISSATNSKESRFWNFSIALYNKPQVAELCLELQDQYGANINLLLWCLWLEHQSIELSLQRLTAALVAIQKWDADYVQTLRLLRRKMKVEFAQDMNAVLHVREQIKLAELLAEKCEQEWLEKLSNEWAQCQQSHLGSLPDQPFKENLTFYLNYLQVPQAVVTRARNMLRVL